MKRPLGLWGRRLSLSQVQELRDIRAHRRPELAVGTEAAAREFIDEVGFCLLFPAPGVALPSLWGAIDGRARPLPRHHHDPTLHLAWLWKDSLPSQKLVFYGKLLKGKPTLISLDLFPYFYALSDNYGEPDDYLESYRSGQMSQEARRIYEVLLEQGPCDTGRLRREAGLWGHQNSARFDRALAELQRSLRIAKCGISQANRWKYAYVYDLLVRWLPEEARRGVALGQREAVKVIMAKYLESAVVATPGEVARLFDWSPEVTERVAQSMLRQGSLREVEVEGIPGRLLAAI